MKVIIEELQNNPNIIVFIDEIHTKLGQVIRPALWMRQIYSNQHFLVVKSNVLELTTNDEYLVKTLKRTVR